jgi:hypothetical protein
MTTASLVSIPLALWLAVSGSANAQVFEADQANRPAEHPSTQGTHLAAPAPDDAIRTQLPQPLCALIQSAAAKNDLPVGFFARLIWQESRLRPDAVGPLTRGGRRAQGIAQFMPSTAAERLLADPFDPVQALPKSAEFIRELRAQFGNLGLAVAAYNAGPQRVNDWLAGKRSLPSETLAYVRTITGRHAAEWRRPEASVWNTTILADTPCTDAAKVTAKPTSPAPTAQPKSPASWAVLLIGDRSEISARAAYSRLSKKHEAVLGAYQPVVVQTMGVNTTPIWHRVRIEANSRAAADSLCSRLRAAGASCLVQRI